MYYIFLFQKTDLGLLLFMADNLAYFPYVSQDEPLYIISQIEVYVSVSGSNVLHSIKEVGVIFLLKYS